jgi:DHA2 family multidrug resistance protein
MDARLVLTSGFIQGLGTGLVFVPLTTLAFATLDPRYRNEGSAMFTLIRNIGSSIGISALSAMTIRNASIVHSRLVEGVRPDNPAVAASGAIDFASPASVAAANGEVTRQAMMVSYVDAFWFLLIITLCAMPLILFMRGQRRAGARAAVSAHLD